MNIVDSSGWLSYFASDKNSRYFQDPIGQLEELLVPSITLTEVFKNILRQGSEEAALRAIAHMEQGKLFPLMKGWLWMRLISELSINFPLRTALFSRQRTDMRPLYGRRMQTSGI